ncbi:hypothetical protein H5410_034659 [Solanum commersonii]|uniref:Uncharacterized protein n=1 Tax=Solanum commersonii TaxID=4109 RepID=A0A9J5YS06_SOLCO|nr:hypothetical protein H5410_034659 [Solanum commersonii]
MAFDIFEGKRKEAFYNSIFPSHSSFILFQHGNPTPAPTPTLHELRHIFREKYPPKQKSPHFKP